MKNVLHKCIALLTLTLVITSCSQTQDLAKNDGPQYRYRKVYEGNKIIYRDMDDAQPIAKKTSTTDRHARLEPSDPISQNEELPVSASVETRSTSEENFSTEVANTFKNNLDEVRTGISTGDFLFRHRLQKDRTDLGVSYASEEDDDNTMIGTYEIFAILGFAFGVASLFGGLVLAILGVIFSILGLNSGYRIFAVIGLICGIVGFILILI
ncbi:MAG: hypothetical protein RLP14_04770 [Owenweeksia sp.]